MKVTLNRKQSTDMDLSDIIKGIKDSSRSMNGSYRYNKDDGCVYVTLSDGKGRKCDHLTANEVKLVKALDKVEELFDVVDRERRSMMRLS